MTFEEQVAYHEQWLRSMESNHNQITADLAAVSRNLEGTTRDLAQVARNQVLFTSAFAEAMARLAAEQERQARVQAEIQAELKALTERVNSLAETVNLYIRFRGDGNPKN